jgi:hypothetical protein
LQLGAFYGKRTLNDSFVFDLLHGWTREVNFIVYHEQGIIVFQYIIIQGNSIKVLLE